MVSLSEQKWKTWMNSYLMLLNSNQSQNKWLLAFGSDRKETTKALGRKKAIKWAEKQKGSLKTLAGSKSGFFLHYLLTVPSTSVLMGRKAKGDDLIIIAFSIFSSRELFFVSVCFYLLFFCAILETIPECRLTVARGNWWMKNLCGVTNNFAFPCYVTKL